MGMLDCKILVVCFHFLAMLPYGNKSQFPPDFSKNEFFPRNMFFPQQIPKLCEKLIFIITFQYLPDKGLKGW